MTPSQEGQGAVPQPPDEMANPTTGIEEAAAQPFQATPPEEDGQPGVDPVNFGAQISAVESYDRRTEEQAEPLRQANEKEKDRLARALYQFLIDRGVNPEDPKSVQQFLMKLEQEDHDTAEIIFKTLDALGMGAEGMPEQPGEAQSGQPMEGMPEGMPQAPPEGMPPAPMPDEAMATDQPVAPPTRQ